MYLINVSQIKGFEHHIGDIEINQTNNYACHILLRVTQNII